MQLTREQEERYYTKYRGKINAYVKLCASKLKITGSLDDYYSEAAILFINHMRKCATENDIKNFSFYDIMHAMCKCRMNGFLMSHDSNVYRGYKTAIENERNVESYDALPEYVDRECVIVDYETRLEMRHMLESASDIDKYIVTRRLEGATQNEIADELGKTRSWVVRELTMLKKKYFEED